MADLAPDFFVSYAHEDVAWARWISVELEKAGYTTISQTFDFRPGGDFVQAMHRAVAIANRTIAVLSPNYFQSEFGEVEWRPAFAKDPSGELGSLVPVRVVSCSPPGMLRTRIYIDLVDVNEATARERLLSGVSTARDRPKTVLYPGGGQVPFPGGLSTEVRPRSSAQDGRSGSSGSNDDFAELPSVS